jgi:hypothetical protein
MPGKPSYRIPIDFERRTIAIPAGSITSSQVSGNISTFYMPICILDTSKLAACVLGNSPMILDYGRLNLSILL